MDFQSLSSSSCGKRAEAHQMLAEIHHWFTESFDTKDLQEAKALLEERSCLTLSPFYRTSWADAPSLYPVHLSVEVALTR
jgi:hypothetical protein